MAYGSIYGNTYGKTGTVTVSAQCELEYAGTGVERHPGYGKRLGNGWKLSQCSIVDDFGAVFQDERGLLAGAREC